MESLPNTLLARGNPSASVPEPARSKRSARALGTIDPNRVAAAVVDGKKHTLRKARNPKVSPKKKVRGDDEAANDAVGSNDPSANPPPDLPSSAASSSFPAAVPSSSSVLPIKPEAPIPTADGIASMTRDLGHATLADPENTAATTEVDWKNVQKELDELFVKQSNERMKGVPRIRMPRIFARNGIELFDHQKEGIRWLVHKEVTNMAVPPYYKLRTYGLAKTERYYCSLDSRIFRGDQEGAAPEPLRHSILADDMGLGKTLQSIGLILANPPAGRNGFRGYPYRMPRPDEYAPPRCTIIVCPVSVMSNWKLEIDKFVHKKQQNILTVEMYQGPSRSKVLRKVREGTVDIMICSYQTLSSDLKKQRKLQEEEEEEADEAETKPRATTLVFDLNYHRIILDEAHTIRNARTLYFHSVKALRATHKLCLTGTPFVNHPRDIHSLLDFLDVEPFNDTQVFNDRVVEPIEARREVGLARLRVVMGALAIRRTKAEVDNDTAGVRLVPKTVQIRRIAFADHRCRHKTVSEMMYHTCRMAYLALTKGGSQAFGHNAYKLFGMVVRVRQSCCDASLVPGEVQEEVASLWEEFRGISIDHLGYREGMVLFDKLVDALQAANQRIEASKTDGDRVVHSGDRRRWVLARPTEESGFGRSPKVQALLDAFHEMKADEKGVIFSQWTGFLDIIQKELELEGHTFARIDGSVNAMGRYEVMKRFASDECESPRFLLCSLRACGTGINLTRANHIFMMDTWWNVAEENQAMDRVHRIGQVRPVRAIRFIMKDSIEERFVEVQDAKEALGKGSMERLKREDRSKAKLTALKDLFEMKARKHVWEGTFVDDEDDAFDDGSDLMDFIVPDDRFD